MIGKTISHYKILEKIGEGGMGVVYKAMDTRLDRVVALKFLPEQSLADEEAKTRFVQEAKAASAIDHPNISTVHDIDEADGKTFISMAYVDGKSFKELARGGNLSVQEIVKIAVQAAEGLGAAHKRGIVHRDVKSDNLMLTKDGHVKVMDFGLAKLKGARGVTKAGETVGTAYYMSPEQTRGEDVDHRSDIFSFGVVLYELITGQLPFTGDYDPAIAYAILNQSPRPVGELRPDTPPELEAIVARALEKEAAKRYQSMDELISDLRKLWEGRTSEIRPAVAHAGSKFRFLVPAAAIVILAAIALMKFMPVKGPPPGPVENTLAVMYFDNMVDPGDASRLGEIMANLLITDLSESRFVKVVSSQRLYDILKALGKEGAKRIDRDVATRVAQKAHAKWMLLGSILQTDPYMVVTSQLVDVQNGNIVDSQRIDGAKSEEVFSIVDKLTVEVKEDLALPEEALTEPDIPVAEVTTASPEAYRHYLEGLDLFYKAYTSEAEDSFRKAVELDSTFAMAYFRLALTLTERDYAEGVRMMDEAVRHSDKATKKQKYLISGFKALMINDLDEGIRNLKKIVEHYPDDKEAYFWLGVVQYQVSKPAEAISMFKKAVELDPLYKSPYNMLAYCYADLDDFENSIWAINKYISLGPEEANPYDTRGEIYAENGKLDPAIDSYETALEKKPNFGASLEALGHMWTFKGDYDKAARYYRRLASSDDSGERATGRIYLALVPLYRGQFERGLSTLDDAIAADVMDGGETLLTAVKYLLKAEVYIEKGDLDAAVAEAKRVLGVVDRIVPGSPTLYMSNYGLLLAKKGELAKAETVAADLKARLEAQGSRSLGSYWWLMSGIERARGDMGKAMEYMNKANADTPMAPFVYRFGLADLYLQSGRLGDAIAVLEKALARYDTGRAQSPIKSAKLHYMLGKAYEGSGWREKAAAKYRDYLEIMKDADSGNPVVEDAKERLDRLESGTAGAAQG